MSEELMIRAERVLDASEAFATSLTNALNSAPSRLDFVISGGDRCSAVGEAITQLPAAWLRNLTLIREAAVLGALDAKEADRPRGSLDRVVSDYEQTNRNRAANDTSPQSDAEWLEKNAPTPDGGGRR
jgi:hypothetical protein